MAKSVPDALPELIETAETTPLLLPLSPESQADSPEDGTNGGISSNAALKSRKHSHLYPYVVILAGLFSLVADMGGSLIDTPEVRLLEMAVCRDYYRSHDPSLIGPPPRSYVPEKYCKLAIIQRDLAYLRAIKSLLMTLPGLVLTFFYGRLADKIGRRPVMLLGMTGQVLCYFWMILVCYFHEALPTKLVLLSPAFLMIGGGVRVLSAIVNTLVVDVSPENMRTTVFYSIGAAVLITDIVAAPVGSWLLSQDLWLPYWFSTPIILLSYPIILAIPETVSINQDKPSEPFSPQDENRSSPEPRQLPPLKALPAEAYKYIQRSIQAFHISKDITVCLTMIFLNAFSRCSGSVFIQYVSKLLNWPISTTGYLLSAKSAISLVVLIVLVIITRAMTVKTSTKPLNVDIWVVRSSLALLVAGNLILGFSTNAASVITGSVLASGGTGIVQAMQGVVASFSGPSVIGQLYAGVALVELAGGLLGIMAFAGIFDLGLSFEANVGLGLPFLISSILFIVTVCISFLLPRRVSTSNSAAAMG